MKLIAAVVFGLVLAGVAHAQMPPLTIDMVRTEASVGMAPTVEDVERLSKCPDMHPAEPSGMYQDADAMDEARRLHIPVGALWLRRNDAAIARCLGEVR